MCEYDSVAKAIRPDDIVLVNCKPEARGQVTPD